MAGPVIGEGCIRWVSIGLMVGQVSGGQLYQMLFSIGVMADQVIEGVLYQVSFYWGNGRSSHWGGLYEVSVYRNNGKLPCRPPKKKINKK